MMTHAYSEFYLSDAKKSLGTMVDYVVHDCEYNVDWMIEFFLKSGYAKQFEKGNPAVVGGMSGVELAREIIKKMWMPMQHSRWTRQLNIGQDGLR